MQQFFITYPDRMELLRNSYSIIAAVDEEAARAEVVHFLGSKWAFMYPIEELDAQVYNYKLTPITIADAANVQFMEGY